MKNRIDIRALLNIYEKIKKHGQTIENGSQLVNQTSAQLNQSNESQIQVFLTKLEAINAKY